MPVRWWRDGRSCLVLLRPNIDEGVGNYENIIIFVIKGKKLVNLNRGHSWRNRKRF